MLHITTKNTKEALRGQDIWCGNCTSGGTQYTILLSSATEIESGCSSLSFGELSCGSQESSCKEETNTSIPWL